MPKVTFRMAPHSLDKTKQIVEILHDGKVCGAIYPQDDGTIRLVSGHLASVTKEAGFAGQVVIDEGLRSWPPIPALHVRFLPDMSAAAKNGKEKAN